MDSKETLQVDAKEALQLAVSTVPIPGSPPPGMPDDAAVGLAFLDMALRQNHVRRITDRLLLQEHLAPRCRAEIDISLNLLHQDQRDACEVFRQARQRSMVKGHEATHPAGRGRIFERLRDDASIPEDMIWVPVARLPRQAVAPIDVRDSTGAKLPRLTQLEVAMPLAGGLYQLLRGILSSIPEARMSGDLARLLYRVDSSRWLLQAALQALFVSRTSPSKALIHDPSPRTLDGNTLKYRNFLKRVLIAHEKPLAPFYSLLNVALADYLLIVGLPQPRENHLLSYEVPLLAKPPDHRRRPDSFRRKVSGVYQVEYVTHLPSSLRSYHLVAETDPSLQIEKMHITSDADRLHGASIASDLDHLAGVVERCAGPGKDKAAGKIAELELRTVIGELAQLVTRRRWEADEAKLPWSPELLPAIDALSWASLSGEIPERKKLQAATLLNHPLVSGRSLRHAAAEVGDLRLGHDFFRENEPASYQAHVYWRRYAHLQSSARRTVVRSGIAIIDAAQTGLRVVMMYVAAVLAVSYLTAALLSGSLFPLGRSTHFMVGGRSDAIVAVLLLVPGFLYSRLDLPPRNSVAARVRIGPRWTAHLTMAVVVMQAAVVAASESDTAISFAFGVGCAVLLSILVCLFQFGRQRKHEVLLLDSVPKWVDEGGGRRAGRASVDVVLFASGVNRD